MAARIARCRAVHDRCAETAHDPHRRRKLGEADEVKDVLDDRETGADREAHDDRVERQSDPVDPEQPDDDDGLQRLLDPGRGEPAVIAETDRKRVEEVSAQRIGGDRSNAADKQKSDRLPEADELERRRAR